MTMIPLCRDCGHVVHFAGCKCSVPLPSRGRGYRREYEHCGCPTAGDPERIARRMEVEQRIARS